MAMNYDERDVTFDILEEIGIISTQATGWTKELNLVRWNGGPAKYDIRDWDPSHERMSRGITLKEDEMRRVLTLMKRRRSGPRMKKEETAEEMTPEYGAGDSPQHIEINDAAGDIEGEED